jgi:hypothetical protein
VTRSSRADAGTHKLRGGSISSGLAPEAHSLTETGTDDLPIPNDDELQGRAVREDFEALIGTLQGTGLGSEIEPLAHGFATLLQRRATMLDESADRLKLKIEALIGTQDGSEVAEQELEDTQRLFGRTWERRRRSP